MPKTRQGHSSSGDQTLNLEGAGSRSVLQEHHHEQPAALLQGHGHTHPTSTPGAIEKAGTHGKFCTEKLAIA